MAHKLPDLESWAMFAAVVRHRSFSAAAAATGVGKSTVSKAVARLETHLGQSLFHRTTRRLTLTEAGRPLAERAQRILAEAEAAEEAARSGATEPAGPIRLAAPMSFGIAQIAPLVARFLALHPAIEIDLHLSDEQVDIVAEGFDVALRVADLADSSLRARTLCRMPLHFVAAPAYLAAHGTPDHPARLADHRIVAYANRASPWRFAIPGAADVVIRQRGPMTSNNGEASLAAVRAGLGIALLPGFIVRPALDEGSLVEILRDWAPPPLGVHLLTPPSALRPARVESLIAFLSTNLARLQA